MENQLQPSSQSPIKEYWAASSRGTSNTEKMIRGESRLGAVQSDGWVRCLLVDIITYAPVDHRKGVWLVDENLREA